MAKLRARAGSSRPLHNGYAELAVTSNFSFLRGASHPEEFALQATELGLAGIGIADRNSVAGVVRAHSIAQEKKLRLAVGARLPSPMGLRPTFLLILPTHRLGRG